MIQAKNLNKLHFDLFSLLATFKDILYTKYVIQVIVNQD